ncbi:MAG: dipeptide ABC transporter ATP-binding protein [Desulfobacteraceae bacterium]|jgi:oligopeptide/dipeptide ABC transporter ATP-binding protein|nr:dipeptide ABC transporter ATP-binding protein [Desulfobacteraceae bacterium]
MGELLTVRHLVKHFPLRRGFWGRQRAVVHAVDDISFSIAENETLGLVGESGCGKSTAGFSILRLIEPTSGEVWFEGENLPALDAKQLRDHRRRMQIVFQDPFGSLNPRLTVERIVEEPLLNYENLDNGQRRQRVADALETVGLLPEHMTRFPHEFSGGQRQRICVARTLVLQPRLVIGDEPVSALDVSVRAQVLNLMVRLQRRLKLSYLFISHDLSVIRYVSHRVGVMYLGRLVELADVKTIYDQPAHPYTRALLSAVPVPDPRRRRRRIVLQGDVPSPISPPPGYHFHPRCPEAMAVCRQEPPRMRRLSDGHRVCCHLYNDREEWIVPPPASQPGIRPQPQDKGESL